MFFRTKSISRIGSLISATAGIAVITTLLAAAAEPFGKIKPAISPVWTGCKVGGNLGALISADQVDISLGPTAPAADIAASRNSHSLSGTAVMGGLQLGCDWQATGSPFVMGVEGDFNWTGSSQSETVAYPNRVLPGGGNQIPHYETVGNDLKWFSTVRGRAGYAADRWLVYATGGLAFGSIESSFTYGPSGGSVFTPSIGSATWTRAGWTVGGGLEHLFSDRWSAKAEYLYLDFGKRTYHDPNQFDTAESATRSHIVRVGLNYKFR